jgi:hypothetical protein
LILIPAGPVCLGRLAVIKISMFKDVNEIAVPVNMLIHQKNEDNSDNQFKEPY